MLDQNTNRLWFLIGVALTSVVLILFVTEQFPGLFAESVDETTQQAVTDEVKADPTIKEVSIPYEVEYTTDPNAVREGQNGLKLVSDDGSEPKIVSEPVNRVRLYPTTSETVSFETEYRDNPDQPVGWSQVVQEGADGTTVYYIDPHTDEIVEEVPGESTAAQPRIIEEGSAPTETIDFDTEYTLNPDEVRDGQQGRGYTDSNGAQHTLEEAVNEIVLYLTRTESIPYDTVERENRDLPEGETQVVQQGQNGEKILHYNPETDEVVKEDVSSEPVDRIVEYGTLQKSAIPYDTEYTMDSGAVQSGKDGEKYVYSDGTEEVITEPVNEVVMYPYHTRPIPHSTIEVEDTTKLVGDVTVQTGYNGSKQVYYNPETGEEIGAERIISQPRDEVIERGTINPKWYVGKPLKIAYNAPYGLAYYKQPSWDTTGSAYLGSFPQNKVLGTILDRVYHGGAYQYEVQRPSGTIVYTTASDHYVRVAARLESKVDGLPVYRNSNLTDQISTLDTGWGFGEVIKLFKNNNGDYVYEIRNTSESGGVSSYNTTGYVTADDAKVRVEEASVSSTGTGLTYIVSSGDTLSAIANQHGVSVQQLKDWNGLTSNTIYVGQALVIH